MSAEPEYRGNDRFECVERLGAGAFGTVYRAVDRNQGGHVALKLLERQRPDSLRRFKAEFRALADVSHRNLVSLHELHTDGGRWFFTMELIEGVPLNAHVWHPPDASNGDGKPKVAGLDMAETLAADDPSTQTRGDGSISGPSLAERASLVERFFQSSESFSLAKHDLPPDAIEAIKSGRLTLPESLVLPSVPPRLDVAETKTSDESVAFIAELQRHRAQDCLVPASDAPSPIEDFERLRDAMRQLAEGLAWLHASNRLHRDLKPSNVMVEDHGRVVLLDFGLVASLAGGGQAEDERYGTVGTPAYMAPELCMAEPATTASDWYGFGGLLYKLLTGYPPFVGPINSVLWNKQFMDPRRPSEVCSGIPEDLDQLCMDLLQREPEDRPNAEEVLERLGADAGAMDPFPVAAGNTPFVGRRAEMARLRGAFETARAGQTSVVFVSGSSGMGKTRLVEEFLRSVEPDGQEPMAMPDRPADDDHPTMVLRSRCYAREGVPYKALDPAIDELQRQLTSRHEQIPLDESGLDAASAIFPVLGGQPDRVRGDDPVRLRRRAHDAVIELTNAVSRRFTLVLFIDDLQWADTDSLNLIREALVRPDAPPLCLVAALRSEALDTIDLLDLDQLREGPRVRVPHFDRIDIAPLPETEAAALAHAVLQDPSESMVREMLADAGGSPLFVEELAWRARAANEGDAPMAEHAHALDDLIRWRIGRLPAAARQLLEYVSLAGRPLDEEIARLAASHGPRDVTLLEQANLLRTRPRSEGVALTTFHDRVREAVTDGLDEDRRKTLHLSLAGAALNVGSAESAFLAEHYRRGGDAKNAVIHMRRAAERAMELLAFDRAADLFGAMIELGVRDEAQVHRQRAEALRNAGRGPAAARAFVAAAKASPPDEARHLEIAAVEQFMFSGAYDEGEDVIRQVLGSIGLEVASTTVGMLGAFALQSARLKMRGLDYEPDVERVVPPDEQAVIDILWSATIGMAMANPLASQIFQKRHLRAALDSKSPSNVVRAMATELAFSGLAGGRDERVSADLSRRSHEAEGLVKENKGYAQAFVEMSDGGVHWLRGRWKPAMTCARAALKVYDDECHGAVWEADTARFVELSALIHTGQFSELASVTPELLTDAKDRGDLYLETQVRTRCSLLLDLLHDDPDGARRTGDEAISRWTPSGYHIVHFWRDHGIAHSMLYEGRHRDALDHLQRIEPALRRSLLLLGQYYRTLHVEMLGRVAVGAALAAVRRGESDRAAYKIGRQCARKLEREDMDWCAALAAVLRAGLSLVDGKANRACEQLRKAGTALDELDMVHRGHAARWLADRPPRGDNDGASAGSDSARAAEAWASAQGASDPRAFLSSWLFGT